MTQAVDETERARLDAAVKASDGFFTTFFISPWSRYVARWCARRGITPNQVTITSLVVGLIAAGLFATGERGGLVAGAVLLLAAFALDCVDGQLARYTHNFSPLGAWLDSIFDRAKEYAAFAGLAIGSGEWTLAAAALALQTVRHMVDLAGAEVDAAIARARAQPPAVPSGRPSALGWLKRIVQFPIGERFAVIAVLAAVSGARAVFVVLLAWNAIALAYVVAGRLRKTAGVELGVLPRIVALRDDGPLARRLLPEPRGARAWLWPAAVRALEYGGIVVAGAVGGAPWPVIAFAVLAALAFHHYDLIYRPGTLGTEPRRWPLGWEGRLLLMFLAVTTTKEID